MAQSRIPAEFVFNPNWWFRNCGISFDQDFYFDRNRRIEDDVRMRRALYERFGLGEADPQPRPIIGSQHVAGGFVVPALLGVEIRFEDNQAPWPVARNLSRKEIMALQVPDVASTWPMKQWIAGMDALEKEFGHVAGDVNCGGLVNTALELRGQQFFLDLLEDPELADHLLSAIAQTQARVVEYVSARTGTSSVSVNRSILNVDRRIFLQSNCSVQMISPALYRSRVLKHEHGLAARLPPFGIHHCGRNLQLFAGAYAELPLRFLDVGWGSDAKHCAEAFPDMFLNLRLSPVRMLQRSAEEVFADTVSLLAAADRKGNVGVCSINMDYGTPDQNVLAVLKAVEHWSR